MKRPAIVIFICFAAGSLMRIYFDWFYVVMLLFAIIVCVCLMTKVQQWKFLAIFSMICLVGYFNSGRVNCLIQKIDKSIDYNKPIEATAEIKEIEFESNKMICKLSKISQGNYKVNTGIKVIIYGKNIEPYKVGDRIQVMGNMQSFLQKTNPGAFDARQYYYADKIYFTVYASNIKLLNRGKYDADRILNNFRVRLESQVNKLFPSNEASIMNTMLLGSKGILNDSTKELYQVAGISHLLAISGLHVSIIGMGLFQLLKNFIKSQRTCGIICIVILWLYCVLTGGSTSTLRATIMLTLMLLTIFFNESYEAVSALFIAGTMIVVVNPYQLLDVGFLLSFAAVYGILSLTPILNTRYNSNNNMLINMLFVTLGASLFTYPILAWFFYKLSIYSIIVNLFIVPVSTILIAFGILAILVSFIWLPAGEIVGGIVYFALKYIEMCCEGVMKLPLNTLTIGKPSILMIFYYYVFVCVRQKKVMVVIVLLCTIFIGTTSLNQIGRLKATFLDVGQGDSAVIQYSSKVFIVDGGGKLSISKNSTTNNTGIYVLIPYLESEGINHIDGIFISHSDFDHIYGIIEVIKEIKTDFIVLPKPYEQEQDDLTKTLLTCANDKGIEVYYFSEGYKYKHKGFHIECIYPKISEANYKNNNEKSLVLNVRYKDFNVLFTGDIEEPQEDIIQSHEGVEADIIKVPHHGSETSSTHGFLERVDPTVAIFSYGKHNIYGHPAVEVVKRYKLLGIDEYHISNEGAVIITTKGETYLVETYFTKRKVKYICNN
ncbi:MAG: DNA internalization-related competence protein ComEC/Rec2 [Firmicutes bacterium HGW-Firmicutes-1]|jgi:competence protein ComEC|nr:MAG: DNA internalization-related competence protein ComEC/Rec2 [Firmicutes bacterium HGW-Firmicutes-1]